MKKESNRRIKMERTRERRKEEIKGERKERERGVSVKMTEKEKEKSKIIYLKCNCSYSFLINKLLIYLLMISFGSFLLGFGDRLVKQFVQCFYHHEVEVKVIRIAVL